MKDNILPQTLTDSISDTGIFDDPISFDYFKVPVVAPDGWTYDHKNLVEWLKSGKRFFPNTRQDLVEDVVLYPNFSVAHKMVELGIMKKIPFLPGETFQFRINSNIDNDSDKLARKKAAFLIVSLLDTSLNVMSIFSSINNLSTENNTLGRFSLGYGALACCLNIWTFVGMFVTVSPFIVRKCSAANAVVGFLGTIINCCAVTALYSKNQTLSLQDFGYLSPIAKTSYYGCNLIQEMKDRFFFSPKKVDKKATQIELV